jgi:hypothetical protein
MTFRHWTPGVNLLLPQPLLPCPLDSNGSNRNPTSALDVAKNVLVVVDAAAGPVVVVVAVVAADETGEVAA